MKRESSLISKVLRGSSPVTKVMRGTTLIWENWIRLTGALWQTVASLTSWGFSISVDTGIKTTPDRVKPITVSLQTIGNQQDGSSQQMTRTITGYRKSDGVAVQLYTITSALGPSINTTDSVTIDGSVEYNRLVGTCSGKLSNGSSITIRVTDWFQTN